MRSIIGVFGFLSRVLKSQTALAFLKEMRNLEKTENTIVQQSAKSTEILKILRNSANLHA